jgi:uncharacterized protein YpmS
MIKSKILVTLLCCSVFVASCSMQQNSTSHNSNNTLQPSQLSSSTGTSTLNQGVNGEIQTADLDIVKPKLSMSYHFLNSEKVAYETSTF